MSDEMLNLGVSLSSPSEELKTTKSNLASNSNIDSKKVLTEQQETIFGEIFQNKIKTSKDPLIRAKNKRRRPVTLEVV